MKILVVDDSGIMRKVIIRELQNMNIPMDAILEAEDGQQAVKAAIDGSLALILMDWNMPNMLGIDAVKAIRAGGIDTPILMVTTEAERANVVKAIQAGANNYLVKPFTGEALQEKILAVVPEISALAELKETTIDLDTGRVVTD